MISTEEVWLNKESATPREKIYSKIHPNTLGIAKIRFSILPQIM
jgi:hypothetical protein